MKTVFLPRQWLFWLYCVSSWLVYMLCFPFTAMDAEQGISWTSDLLRFVLTMPVLLSFRYLYQKNEWHHLSLIETISVTFGFNLCTTILVVYFVPFSIASGDIWFDLFQRESITTARTFDEKFISFFYSYVYQLAWSFVYIMFNARQLNEDLTTKEEAMSHELKDVKIHVLANQISPHFLFNGLNNLCSLIDEDSEKAQSVVRSFSELLRYCLEAHKYEKASIEREVAFVEHYVALSKIQYEDRLRFSIDVPELVYSYVVPPMMIQLLVENAIKHGVGSRKDGSDVAVKVYEKGYFIYVVVSNDGVLSNKVNKQEGGFGLQNIHERLQLLYDTRANFSIEEYAGKVVASLKIPKEKFYESGHY